MVSTSTGNWPTDCVASRRNSTPASRAMRPISAAGLTRPPLVGTWLTPISFTRSSMSPASAAPAAAYFKVEDGKITRLRFIFDRVPYEAAGA